MLSVCWKTRVWKIATSKQSFTQINPKTVCKLPIIPFVCWDSFLPCHFFSAAKHIETTRTYYWWRAKCFWAISIFSPGRLCEIEHNANRTHCFKIFFVRNSFFYVVQYSIFEIGALKIGRLPGIEKSTPEKTKEKNALHCDMQRWFVEIDSSLFIDIVVEKCVSVKRHWPLTEIRQPVTFTRNKQLYSRLSIEKTVSNAHIISA